MNPKAENIINQLNATLARLQRPLLIVETGTIRNREPQYEQGDGHSTRHIIDFVIQNPGTEFYSIDIDTDRARSYLTELHLIQHVNLCQDNSINRLKTFGRIDFAYLDSENNARMTMDEFLLVWPKVPAGGCVMVDDCNEQSVELFKGDILMPHLRNNGINFEHLPTNQIIIIK